MELDRRTNNGIRKIEISHHGTIVYAHYNPKLQNVTDATEARTKWLRNNNQTKIEEAGNGPSP